MELKFQIILIKEKNGTLLMNQNNKILNTLENILGNTKYKILAGPIIIFLILSMMILPLPPFILDLLFAFNISFSIIILLISMFTKKTLDFIVFPTILLFSTLLRLALNVASARIILLNGHHGNSSAGKIIDAFGNFLVGGNFAVGIIIFSMLVIINFMVITKGAVRIAEVGARFILDGMPGKQMAIDADLNSGIIGEKEAKKRRREVSQESDFYGSMDGASKFVRGDAVAGILIMIINLIGGLLIGVIQHDMDLSIAGKTYTVLTIGDGLVAQIPALIISTAAGVIVTRVSTNQDVGEQIVNQLFNNSKATFLSAFIIGMLGIIPGMPNIVFLFFSSLLFFITWTIYNKSNNEELNENISKNLNNNNFKLNEKNYKEATWNDVHQEDVLGLEVGYKLISMVDDSQNNGELIKRIRGIRKQFAREMGFLPPVVHIRDNLEISPIHYCIFLNGVEIGFGDVHPEKLMAINPGNIKIKINGNYCNEPAFGLSAVWIEKINKEQAITIGYTVVDSSTVIATHIHSMLIKYAGDIFGRQEAQNLLEHTRKITPKLIDGLIPEILSLTTFHKVLQNLLLEKISIRDIRSIIECLAENSPQQTDVESLTSLVRQKLGRAITQNLFPKKVYKNEINVIGLDPSSEKILITSFQSGGSIEPNISNNLIENIKTALIKQEKIKSPFVLIVNPVIRSMMSKFLKHFFPNLTILSNLEIIDDRPIKFTSIISCNAVKNNN
ncbi:flhA [Wigglesworthia glossinidia endosymbiont of Glossina brevipalpis]|uniref:Flagellar biosynthesis protein FlhA n=1 Tax=Wigglesworthia glossinidia brevipalpis TaxID=36870 RepID=Q8D3G6_WIGBR|nr:flhA [Wigglesworthia glossinidia endosymbiont of Glossina brevipalpis]